MYGVGKKCRQNTREIRGAGSSNPQYILHPVHPGFPGNPFGSKHGACDKSCAGVCPAFQDDLGYGTAPANGACAGGLALANGSDSAAFGVFTKRCRARFHARFCDVLRRDCLVKHQARREYALIRASPQTWGTSWPLKVGRFPVEYHASVGAFVCIPQVFSSSTAENWFDLIIFYFGGPCACTTLQASTYHLPSIRREKYVQVAKISCPFTLTFE